jgi:excisionase family DNA binding protein
MSTLKSDTVQDNKKFVSPQEAANILYVSKQTLRRYNAENKLRAVKTPGNHNRYDRVRESPLF